jgi:Flp pilus assembly pilin Flp
MLALYLWLQTWLKSQKAQDLIEYALIIALLVVVAVLALSVTGGQISGLFSKIGSWVAKPTF